MHPTVGIPDLFTITDSGAAKSALKTARSTHAEGVWHPGAGPSHHGGTGVLVGTKGEGAGAVDVMLHQFSHCDRGKRVWVYMKGGEVPLVDADGEEATRTIQGEHEAINLHKLEQWTSDQAALDGLVVPPFLYPARKDSNGVATLPLDLWWPQVALTMPVPEGSPGSQRQQLGAPGPKEAAEKVRAAVVRRMVSEAAEASLRGPPPPPQKVGPGGTGIKRPLQAEVGV